MVSIEVRDAFVDFPIFDARSRSLKKKVFGKVGGKIGTGAKVPVIEALRGRRGVHSEGTPAHGGPGRALRDAGLRVAF